MAVLTAHLEKERRTSCQGSAARLQAGLERLTSEVTRANAPSVIPAKAGIHDGAGGSWRAAVRRHGAEEAEVDRNVQTTGASFSSGRLPGGVPWPGTSSPSARQVTRAEPVTTGQELAASVECPADGPWW
jgi:hypothetical protein